MIQTKIQQYSYDFLMLFKDIKDISDLNVTIYPIIKKNKKARGPKLEILNVSENAWKATFKNPDSRKQDLQKIKGIFNKLNRENYDKMITQIKELDYCNEEVIELIFIKIINWLDGLE